MDVMMIKRNSKRVEKERIEALLLCGLFVVPAVVLLSLTLGSEEENNY